MKITRSVFWSAAVVAAAIVCVAVVVVVLRADDRAGTLSLVATLLGLATPVIAFFRWSWMRRHDLTRPATEEELAAAANALAPALVTQWRAEGMKRGIVLPSPVRVRWSWSPSGRSLQPAAALLPSGAGPRTASGGSSSGEDEFLTQGAIDHLHDVYSGAGGGRLTIIGGPGSGKTATAILLVLQALEHRATVPGGTPPPPVPVLLTLSDWDPATEPLVEWAASRLCRDYPVLSTSGAGRHIAAELIRQGQISLLLDGFDEMAAEGRPRALQRIDELPGTRVVVLTRPDEYVGASRATAGRVVLELLAVDADAAADYLMSGHGVEDAVLWQPLAQEVRDRPAGALAKALSTPLMLNLVRVSYPTGVPSRELIELAEVSPVAVEDHLLDRFVWCAYRGTEDASAADDAQRWLGHLASQMRRRGLRDLYWWHLADWLPVWVVGTALGTALGTAFVVGVALFAGVLALVWGMSVGSLLSYLLFLVFPLVFPLGLATGLVLGYGGFGGFVLRRSGLRQARAPARGSRLWGDLRALLVACAAVAGAFCLGGFIISGLAASVSGAKPWVLSGGLLVDILSPVLALAGVSLLFALALRLCGFTSGSPVTLGLAWPRRTHLVHGVLVGGGVGSLFALLDRMTVSYGSSNYENVEQPAMFVGWSVLAGLLGGCIASLVQAGMASFPWSTPDRLWFADLRSAAVAGCACASVSLLILAFFNDVDRFFIGFGTMWVLAWLETSILATEAARLGVVGVVLCCRRAGPLRVMRFLRDGQARNVLRQAGPTYQFRHARLQDRLADNYEARQSTEPARAITASSPAE